MKALIMLLSGGILFSGCNAQSSIFFTGTTDTKTVKVISICELDEKTGDMKVLNSCEGGKGPGYLSLSSDGKFLYATSEERYDPGINGASVNSFIIDYKKPDMKPVSTESSHGIHPCHISTDPDDRFIFTANYVSGTLAVHPITGSGEIGKAVSVFSHKGSGPNKSRQEGPHAHFAGSSTDGRYLYCSDLGIDKIKVYRIEKGIVVANDAFPEFILEPGSGPRHMAFHPDGRHVFILCELSNELISCIYNPDNGSLTELDKKSSLEQGFKGNTKAAAIRVHPGGEFIYCSNRGENSIAVFHLDKDGSLEMIQSFKEGIATVRDFNITPSGKYLIAGNQDRNELVLMGIGKDGKLSATGKKLDVTVPTCVVFAPVQAD